jgi:hypothetical protein
MKSLTLDSVSMDGEEGENEPGRIMNSDLEYFDIVMHYKEIMKSTPALPRGSRQTSSHDEAEKVL